MILDDGFRVRRSPCACESVSVWKEEKEEDAITKAPREERKEMAEEEGGGGGWVGR